MTKSSNPIEEYISRFPKEVQLKLEEIRKLMKEIAPEAKEEISYGIPALRLGKVRAFIFFGAFKKHISVFPFPSGVPEFQKLAEGYETAKGTIKFPLDQPIPFDLIEKITRYRKAETLERLGGNE